MTELDRTLSRLIGEEAAREAEVIPPPLADLHARAAGRRRRRWIVLAVGAAAAVAVVATSVQLWPDRSGTTQTAAPAATDESSVEGSTAAAGKRGALPQSAGASCTEEYSLDALTSRAFAFDGVVVGVGPSVSDRGDQGDLGLSGVTFEVREWFTGGDAQEVTVDLQGVNNESGAEWGLPFEIGQRLLISGEPRWAGAPLDSPIAWSCGFSRFYDEQTASQWRESTTP